MKSHFQTITIALMILAADGMMPLSAAPAATLAAKPKTEISKSVFVMPTSPKEGRDPFFPDSQRPYISNPTRGVDMSALSRLPVKAILPSGNRAFAIIGNHTFAPGDDGIVTTSDGERLRIHCVDIDVQANTVTVEANGAKAVLHFSGRP